MSNAITHAEVSSFWSLLSRLYTKRDGILESSNRIVRCADQVDAMDTPETFSRALHGEFDATELRKTFSQVQEEINSILSYSHDLYPHLKNPSYVSNLSNMAHLLVLQMGMPANYVGLKLREISLGLRMFAQSSNKLILKPTKKSIKYAFGIDVGTESAKIKAYVERHYSNY